MIALGLFVALVGFIALAGVLILAAHLPMGATRLQEWIARIGLCAFGGGLALALVGVFLALARG